MHKKDFEGWHTLKQDLSHLQLYDAKRLLSHKSRICTLSDDQFVAVKGALKDPL